MFCSKYLVFLIFITINANTLPSDIWKNENVREKLISCFPTFAFCHRGQAFYHIVAFTANSTLNEFDRCIIGDVIQSLNESLFEIDKCSQLKNFTGKLEECFPEETRQEFQSDADQRIGAMCKDKLRRPTSLSEPMKCRVEVVMRWLSEILRDVDLCRSLHYGLVDLKQCPDHKDVRFVRRIWEALIDDYCLIDE